MAVDIGPRIGLQGEDEFRKQLLNVNQSLKTLGSEMKLVTAEFSANEKSEDALTRKNEVLTKTVSALNDKLSQQEAMLAESVRVYGEADTKTLKWQQAVNETKEALAKTQNEIKQNADAIDHLGDETDETGTQFKKAGKEAASFGDVLKANVLGDLIIKGVDALVNGIKKLGGALKEAVLDGAKFADEINTLAKQTGLSTDQLQEFRYMSGLIDVDLNTITSSMSKLTRSMASGSKDTAAAFAKIGVAVKDADGNLRNNKDVFNEVIDALGRMTNETERDALAMQLFGKSAQDLNPLILAGSAAITQFAQEAHDMGYVMDESSLNSLNSVQDAIDRVKMAGESVKNNLAQALAPTIEELAAKLQDFIANIDWSSVGEKIQAVADKIKEFFNFVSENGSTIAAVLAAIGAGFVAWNVASMVMGLVEAIKAFQLANEGATVAQAALNVVLSANPIGIVITAVAALVAAIITLWNTNEDFRNWCINTWNNVIDWINTAVNNVVTWVSNAWENIKNFFINAPQWFLTLGENIAQGLWDGIKNCTKWLIDKIVGWFNNIVDSVKAFLRCGSPSKLFADEIGAQMAAGVAVGWNKEFNNVRRDIDGSLETLLPDSTANIGVRASMQPATNAGLAESVNAIGTLMGGGNGNLNIVIQADGREFYRATLEDFRLIQSENPVIVPV